MLLKQQLLGNYNILFEIVFYLHCVVSFSKTNTEIHTDIVAKLTYKHNLK